MSKYEINEESIAKVEEQIKKDGYFDIDAFIASIPVDEDIEKSIEEATEEEPDDDTLQMIERWESDTWS